MNHGNETSAAEWERQREQLSAFLDGELSEGERIALERHLQGCAACQHALAELRQVRALLRALPVPALPRAFTLPESGAVPESLRPAARRPAASAARLRLAGAAQGVGTLAAAVGLVILLGSGVVGLSQSVRLSPTGASVAAPSSNQAGGSSALDRNTQRTPGNFSGGVTATPNGNATQSTAVDRGATPTQTPTATPSPTPIESASPARNSFAVEPPSVPVVPLTGAGLLVGGAGLALAGRSARRRIERRG
jgi:negative regulator of sigma E activity